MGSGIKLSATLSSEHGNAHDQRSYRLSGPESLLAAKTTRNGRVGLLATRATVDSGAYARALAGAAPEAGNEQGHGEPDPCKRRHADHLTTRHVLRERPNASGYSQQRGTSYTDRFANH